MEKARLFASIGIPLRGHLMPKFFSHCWPPLPTVPLGRTSEDNIPPTFCLSGSFDAESGSPQTTLSRSNFSQRRLFPERIGKPERGVLRQGPTRPPVGSCPGPKTERIELGSNRTLGSNSPLFKVWVYYPGLDLELFPARSSAVGLYPLPVPPTQLVTANC